MKQFEDTYKPLPHGVTIKESKIEGSEDEMMDKALDKFFK